MMLQNLLKSKNLKIDYENHTVLINDEEIHLTPIEYKIIELMSKYSGRVLTHKFIIDKVWEITMKVKISHLEFLWQV